MGMFDSFYVAKADHLIEIQTKELDCTLDRYYWGDLIKEEKGVTFLIEDYSYSENNQYNDWFIFVLLNGFYVDYAVVSHQDHVDYTKNKLYNLWSNAELQNITLSYLMEKNYQLGQDKSSLINNISQKIQDYLVYLDEPKKTKKECSFSINLNQYQDKQISMKDFLNDLNQTIQTKKEQMYGDNQIYEMGFDDLLNKMSDVGRMQPIESKVLQYVYLNKEKFDFSLDEIVLSHTFQPLVLSLDIEWDKTLFFHMNDFTNLPTYFEYLFNYIKLPSEILDNFIHSHWNQLSYDKKASLFSHNFIEDYQDSLELIFNKYNEKDWANIITTQDFWYAILENNGRLSIGSRTDLFDMVIQKINTIQNLCSENELTFLGAFIKSTHNVSNKESIDNLEKLTYEIIDLSLKNNQMYLHHDEKEEHNLWQKAQEYHNKIDIIHSYYEKIKIDNNMNHSVSNYKNKTLKL
jgi:hypothetical protein